MRVFKLTGNNYAAVYDLPDHRYFAEIYGDDWRIIGFWRTSIKTPLTENELQRRLAERQAVEGKAVSIRAAVALTAAPASTIYKLLSSGSLKSENGKNTMRVKLGLLKGRRVCVLTLAATGRFISITLLMAGYIILLVMEFSPRLRFRIKRMRLR